MTHVDQRHDQHIGQPPTNHRRWKRACVALIVTTWAILIIGGTLALARHDETPGEPASQRPTPIATLVMVVHPDCPCTRASLAELSELLVHFKGRLAATIVFVEPDGADATRGELWQTARQIAGAHAVRDPLGREARRLDARTSGQTFLYAPDGTLRFSGGITASRGHVGENAGVAMIESLLASPVQLSSSASPAAAAVFSTPVFGCALE